MGAAKILSPVLRRLLASLVDGVEEDNLRDEGEVHASDGGLGMRFAEPERVSKPT